MHQPTVNSTFHTKWLTGTPSIALGTGIADFQTQLVAMHVKVTPLWQHCNTTVTPL
jgi:hypothetical protein